MPERDLLNALYQSLVTWQRVTDLLESVGKLPRSKPVWYKIAHGITTPNREHCNAIRLCFPGMPLIPPGAALLLDKFGITEAVQAHPDPDIVILVNAGDAEIHGVTLKTGDGKPRKPVRQHVTQGNKRLPWQDRVLGYYDSLPSAEGNFTICGKTVNFEALRDVMSRSRDDAGPPWFGGVIS